MKKIALLIVLITLAAFLTGCKITSPTVIPNMPPETTQVASEKETVTLPSYPPVPINKPNIEQQEVAGFYEAEDCEITGNLLVSTDILGFSGKGYVTNFDSNQSLVFKVDIPATQHYDIGIAIAADFDIECKLKINGKEYRRFRADGSGKFTLITLYGVFITEGETLIEIVSPFGDINADYLTVAHNTLLSDIPYDVNKKLSNTNSAENTVKLMNFITDNYGKKIISGQYVSDNTNKEIDYLSNITGKSPLIRFAALQTLSDDFSAVEAATDWYRKGGIVGFSWNWKSPGKAQTLLAEKTDFSLWDAVCYDYDLAALSQEEIRGLFGEGLITAECYGIILDIDAMAGQLTVLKNRGIPVLWRPLHEAAGGWYWWGADGCKPYKWLWELMYTRMTEYFGLDNLIWVWNGQSGDYLIDSDMYDIASLDVYLKANTEYSSRYEQMVAMTRIISKGKPISLSECGAIPNIDDCFRDNAIWAYFGLWYGSYLEDIAEKDLIKAYNSEAVLTLGDLKQ